MLKKSRPTLVFSFHTAIYNLCEPEPSLNTEYKDYLNVAQINYLSPFQLQFKLTTLETAD